MAKSKAIDRYRQLAKENEVLLNEDILVEKIGVFDSVLSLERKGELVAAVNTLGEPDREIMIRRYYYQQKTKDISYCLDIPVKQVENRLYRSKLKLRKIILSES